MGRPLPSPPNKDPRKPWEAPPVPEKGANGVYADFNEVTATYLLYLIGQGADDNTACKTSFITKKMLDEWKDAGRLALDKLDAGKPLTDKEKLSANFVVAYEKAKEKPVVDALKILNQTARANWNTAAWIAERLQPERFAKPDKINVKHSGTVEIKVALTE